MNSESPTGSSPTEPLWYWPDARVEEPQPGAGDVASIARRALEARRRYAHARGWWLSLLSRVLLKLAGRGLIVPGRGRLCRVRLSGHSRSFRLRLGTTDWYSLEDSRIHRVYDPARNYLQARKIEPQTIIDLGSNIGLTVDLWQEWFPAARIIAVEPDGANVRVGRLNTRGKSSFVPVRWVEAAVAARDGSVEMDRTPGEWSGRIAAGESASSNLVRALSIASLLQECEFEGPIEVFKSVVMGAEAQLFADCSGWIDRVELLIVHLYLDSYSTPRLMADLEANSRRPEPLKIFHHVRYRSGSELLFLSRQAP